MRRAHFTFPAAFLLAAGLLLPAAARADSISVALDEVRIITFPKAIGAIDVGNPAIADITMIDTRHASVLGKAYGTTNFIVLGQNGEPISNTRVAVLGGSQATVTMQRGTERTTYSCTANHCEVSPQPGDGKASDAVAGQISAHQNAARQAAAPSGQ
jgi:Flp pilus assembly secretin CpaC